jgi:hydrogenase maturation protease
MNWHSAETIADAVLYEGYLLYPYRGSALKNRYRWQFGIVSPRAHTGGEAGPCLMQTECLIEPGAQPVLDLKVRFLQVEVRQVERLVRAPDQWEAVESIMVERRELITWDEARPRELAVSRVEVREAHADHAYSFQVDGGRELEIVRNGAGEVAARLVRERWPISCLIHVALEPAGEFRKLSVRIENVTPCTSAAESDRPAVLRRSLIGAHTLLAISDGAFVSLLDPPPHAAAHVSGCRNLHTWPVLVGQAPERTLMLSAPIILYDYPSVAPESPGDLFDGTEIDEILTLRVLTLTDQERQEALATDPRARQVIERAAALPPGAFERLHGATRYLGDATERASDLSAWQALLNPAGDDADEVLEVEGRQVLKGSRVRLRAPAHSGRRADAMDMFLVGRTATVAAVYRDLEGQAHIAVTADDARAADLHEANGRYFYFRDDEIEVLDAGVGLSPSATPVRRPRVLVAGIGNIFLGDDGFGPAVIQRLASRALPDWVKVEDFGIRSVHLAYELLGASPAYETTIIIDAVSRGGAPGTLYVLEPDVGDAPVESPDAHTLNVEAVLGFLKGMGGEPGRVLIVGCETASVTPEMGLSDPVTGAVDGAAELVMSLVATAGT